MGDIVGYLACNVCKTPKKIMNGNGKRARFLYGRCECGSDNRTAAVIQNHFKSHQPLEVVEAQLLAINAQSEKPIIANEEENARENFDDDLPGESNYKKTGVLVAVSGGAVWGLVKFCQLLRA